MRRYLVKKLSSLTVILFILMMLNGITSAKTQIVFWTDDDPVNQQLVDEFNRRSINIQVEMQIEPVTGALSTIADKVSVAIAGGKAPDVLKFNRPYASEWAAQGLLMQLDSYMAKLGVKRDQFVPFAWDEGTYNGHVYVLPEYADARAVYFNKTLLAQAGVDMANMPTQLEAFDQLAAKLTRAKGDGSYSQVGFIPWLNQGKYLFSWNPSFGGSFYDPVMDKITVNDSHNVQVLTWMQEYANRFGYSSLKGSFTGSTAAMLVETNGYTQTLNSKPGFEYGVTYMPAPLNGKQKATYAGGFGIAVPTGAKHVQESAEFIAFWVSDEAQLIRARAKGCFPASLKAARDQFFLKDPIQRVFVEMLPNAVARPNIPVLGALWDGIKETTDRVLVKNEVPQAVLDDVTRRVQLLLDQTRKK